MITMVVTIIKMTVTAEEKLIQVMKKMIVIAVMLVWKLMETTKISVTIFMKRIACTIPQKTMWTENSGFFSKETLVLHRWEVKAEIFATSSK